jgi:DNA-directed RNA polymerase specialized sigma24 family protein
LKCHTRVRTTELVLPDETLKHISDYQQVSQTRLTQQDMASASPDYWSIELTKGITDGEKVILSAFYVEGLSYKEIAHQYKISVPKVKLMLMQTKKHLRKVRNTSVLIPTSEE